MCRDLRLTRISICVHGTSFLLSLSFVRSSPSIPSAASAWSPSPLSSVACTSSRAARPCKADSPPAPPQHLSHRACGSVPSRTRQGAPCPPARARLAIRPTMRNPRKRKSGALRRLQRAASRAHRKAGAIRSSPRCAGGPCRLLAGQADRAGRKAIPRERNQDGKRKDLQRARAMGGKREAG